MTDKETKQSWLIEDGGFAWVNLQERRSGGKKPFSGSTVGVKSRVVR